MILLLLYSICLLFFFKSYLFWERVPTGGRAEAEGENPKHTPCWAGRSQMQGWISQPWDYDLSQNQKSDGQLSHQVPLQYIHFKAEKSEALTAIPQFSLGGLGPLLITNPYHFFNNFLWTFCKYFTTVSWIMLFLTYSWGVRTFPFCRHW